MCPAHVDKLANCLQKQRCGGVALEPGALDQQSKRILPQEHRKAIPAKMTRCEPTASPRRRQAAVTHRLPPEESDAISVRNSDSNVAMWPASPSSLYLHSPSTRTHSPWTCWPCPGAAQQSVRVLESRHVALVRADAAHRRLEILDQIDCCVDPHGRWCAWP